MSKYYCVKEGHTPGIYTTWDECKKEISGYKNAVFKKFEKKEEAELFLNGDLTLEDLTIPDDELKHLVVKDLVFLQQDLKNTTKIIQLDKLNKYENDYYIFTDGSFRKTKNTITSKIGIYFGEDTINISNNQQQESNNRCELTAILYSLKYMNSILKDIKKQQKENISSYIFIISDSSYSVDACNKWIFDWVKNDWKKKDGNTISNKDLMFDIYLNLTKLKLHKIRYQIQFENSHKTAPLNDKKKYFLWKGNFIADYLARLYKKNCSPIGHTTD
jgi:ribonuclease HI